MKLPGSGSSLKEGFGQGGERAQQRRQTDSEGLREECPCLLRRRQEWLGPVLSLSTQWKL